MVFFGVSNTKDRAIEILDLINSTFDPLSDYLPSKTEIINLINNKEIFSVKVDSKIASVSIYKNSTGGGSDKFYFRLSCVHKAHRPGIIGYALASSAPSSARTLTTWINDSNIEAITLNTALGYKPDGLKNYIFIKI